MITLVVGGQYGGEGKGKIAAFLAKSILHTAAVCRTGGVNSKHTAVENGKTYDLRQLPTSCTAGFTGQIIYGAGSLVHIPTLFEEMKLLEVTPDKILIDYQTGVVSDAEVTSQRADSRYTEIGSTLTGTGHATAQRALRKLRLARDYSELQPMLGNVPERLQDLLKQGKHILVEGHQGAGLSNYHGDYPYTSNRDATAAALLSELGLGVRYPLRIVLVIKAFPTRNHNGRLPNEMSVEESDKLGIQEYGGGSWGIDNKRRRVGRLAIEDVRRAVVLNTPTELAVTGIDYFEPKDAVTTSYEQLSSKSREFIETLEKEVQVPVSIISTGPQTDATIYRSGFQSEH